MNGQAIATLTMILAAGAYLAWQWSVRRHKSASGCGCGGCSGCALKTRAKATNGPGH